MEFLNLIIPVATFAIGVLLGMRVEVRGFSGIAQDVQHAIADIKNDIQQLKEKFHASTVSQPVA